MSDKKRLTSNFISLLILQGANYILPLITLPYLVRVLGAEKYGLVMFAQAFIQYFIILTDYGFTLSATRQISMNRNNAEKVSEIFSSVMVLKSALLVVSIAIVAIITFSFEKFRIDWEVYLLTFGLVIGNFMFPIWLFQGIEKMKYITFLNILAKLIFTIFIFILIKNPSDYWLVPLINFLGMIFSGSLALWIVLVNLQVKFFIPELKTLKVHFVESKDFFLSRLFVSVYTNSNTFVVGLFLGNTATGFYSAAEKLFTALKSLYAPLSDVLYPYMAQKRNTILFRKLFTSISTFNFILCLFVIIYSDKIITIIYGSDFLDSALILKIFAFACIFIVPSTLLGYPFLAALGFPKYANYSVIISSIIHLFILSLSIQVLNIYLVAYLLLFTEILVLILRVNGVVKIRKII